jgi:hypothetical protein
MNQNKKSIYNVLILCFLIEIISCNNLNNIENKANIKLENKVKNIEDLVQKLKKIDNIKIKEDTVLSFKTLTIKDSSDKTIVVYWLVPTDIFNDTLRNKAFIKRLIISSCSNDIRFRQFTWHEFTFYPFCGNSIDDEQSILIFNSFENELIKNGAKLKHEFNVPIDIENLSKTKKFN